MNADTSNLMTELEQAHNPNTPTNTVTLLLNESNISVRQAALTNPNLPLELLLPLLPVKLSELSPTDVDTVKNRTDLPDWARQLLTIHQQKQPLAEVAM